MGASSVRFDWPPARHLPQSDRRVFATCQQITAPRKCNTRMIPTWHDAPQSLAPMRCQKQAFLPLVRPSTTTQPPPLTPSPFISCERRARCFRPSVRLHHRPHTQRIHSIPQTHTPVGGTRGVHGATPIVAHLASIDEPQCECETQMRNLPCLAWIL